jgi:hypothetical protein
MIRLRCSKQRNELLLILQALTCQSDPAQDREPNDSPLMNPQAVKNFVVRSVLSCAAVITLASCATATFSKSGSDATIEGLRNFELEFIDQFAVAGKRFDAAAFDAKVNEGNSKFQQAIADEKFTARRPVLVDLKGQFDADAAHLRSKASKGKVTPALAGEMKKDVNKIYDHALGR